MIRPFEMADIDAVDNELRFPSLEERMATDFKNAFGYRSISSEIDQLSIFLFMLQEGLWKSECPSSDCGKRHVNIHRP